MLSSTLYLYYEPGEATSFYYSSILRKYLLPSFCKLKRGVPILLLFLDISQRSHVLCTHQGWIQDIWKGGPYV